MRALLTALLILSGALLTLPASLAFWEQHTLLDEDRFVALGNDVLRRDAVQEALVREIAPDVPAIDSSMGPEASRRVAERVARDLPDSDASKVALIGTHDLLVRLLRGEALSTRGNAVIFNLRPVVEDLLVELGVPRSAQARIELPPNTGEIVLVRKAEVTAAFSLGRWFEAASTYIVMAPLVLFALALLVSPNRPAALAWSGACVAVMAVLSIVLIIGPVRSLLIDAVLHDASYQDAARATYDEVAGGYVRQQAILAVVGGVVLLLGAGLGIMRPSRRPG